jgi:large subunit ribosomal protein L31
MKQSIHPTYRPVAFRDKAAGVTFVSGSTRTSDKTVEVDGQTYPVIDLDVSSASHPFWTGTANLRDTEGRVERFHRRYGDRKAAR